MAKRATSKTKPSPKKTAAVQPSDELKKHARTVLRILKKEYPDHKGFLEYRSNLDMTVAVILSAQSTDKRVNIITPALFKKYKTAEDYAKTSQSELESMIKTIGLYRNKAKNIRALGHELVTRYKGEIPNTFDELVSLPGIGRKTANVIMNQAFGKPGMVVDTHVGRISRLLGLTKNTDAYKVELDLMELFPPKEWGQLSLRFISHGRAVCIARRPQCPRCVLVKHCPSASIP